MPIQALILAAGRGSRLGPSAQDTPKPLLEVGRRMLVEHQLRVLAEANVGPTAMVVGYCADEICRTVGPQVQYLRNHRWASTNSLYSFLIAHDWIEHDVVVMNCDVLFDPQILERLLARGPDCLAYDSTSGTGREHMKVRLEGNRVAALRKTLSADDASGENVGVLYLSRETAAATFEAAATLSEEERDSAWLATALEQVARSRPIHAVDVSGLPWGEIDFPYDLERARREVLPAIERQRQARRPVARVLRAAGLLVAMLLCSLLIAMALVESREDNQDWEVIPVTDVPRVAISVRDVPQEWSLFEGNDHGLTTEVHGPTELRLETRLILPASEDAEHSYVIGITWDELPEMYQSERTTASSSASHPEGWVIGKRERIPLQVPPDFHRLKVRLVLPETGRCLVRIRQLVEES